MVTPPGVTPFLPDAVAAQMAAVRQRGFATRLQLYGVTIRLYRDGQPVGAPTGVLVTFADRQAAEVRSGDGATARFREGTVEAFAPWDVEQGDLFTLGSGDDRVDVEVTEVRPTTRGGTVVAAFAMGRDGDGA